MVDPFSVVAMVAGVINAIMACEPIFRKLWLKIKGLFSSGTVSAICMIEPGLLTHSEQKMPCVWYRRIS
jgi:hypothetical protein